jgi:hypothetical protein
MFLVRPGIRRFPGITENYQIAERCIISGNSREPPAAYFQTMVRDKAAPLRHDATQRRNMWLSAGARAKTFAR